MTPIWLVALTLLAPIVPWIGWAPFWAAREWRPAAIWLIFASGVLLDLWWGKPLGQTSLVLVSLAVVIWSSERAWPASGRSFWPIAIVISFLSLEGYLILT